MKRIIHEYPITAVYCVLAFLVTIMVLIPWESR